MEDQGRSRGLISSPPMVIHKVRLNPVLVASAIVVLTGSALTIIVQPRSDIILMFLFFIAGLPIILLFGNFIRTRLYTPEVEWTFLVNQFLFILIPIQALFNTTKLILLIFCFRMLFESHLTDILPKLESQYHTLKDIQSASTIASRLLHLVADSLPLSKLAFF